MNKTIYYNGNIITMEKQLYAEAILIEGNKIKYIGKLSEISNQNTKMYNLEGKTLLPAFIDSHSHITSFAQTIGLISLENTKNFDDIINKIKEFKDNNIIKKNKWIICFGYDNNNLIEKNHPDKNILDKASNENPIIITHKSGHMGVLNSYAIKLLGINSNTENPNGGIIGRIEGTNEPNGYLEETAFSINSSKIPSPSKEKLTENFIKAQNIYFKNGITTAQEGLTKKDNFSFLKMLSENNDIKIDIVCYIDLKNNKEIISENKNYLNKYNNNLKIGGYKIFLDGSPQGKTAWLSKPYINSGNYCGYPIYKDYEINNFIETSFNENMQLLSHCNGDAAAEQLINCFKQTINKKNIKNTLRPVMIHAQTIQYNQLKEMNKINMIASFFNAHTYYWGDTHIRNLGLERASKISPIKSAIENNVIYTLHQDTPVIMPNMIESIWCAVNRITKNGITLGEEEKISPIYAIEAITKNSAYQYFEEKTKGTLKEGKNADMIILDKNPLTTEHNEIKNIKIVETIKSGKTVYSCQ